MIRKALLFLVIFSASVPAFAKQVQVFFSYGTYYSAKHGPYIEVYLKIPSNTLKFKPAGKQFEASAKGDIYIFRNDTVKLHHNFTLKTLPLNDTNSNALLLDLKRLPLPNGKYELLLQVQDENDSTSVAQLEIPVLLNYETGKTALSDILLLDTIFPAQKPDVFTKNGFNMVPTVATFYAANINKLLFYTEAYNAPAGNASFIISLKNTQGQTVEGFTKTRTKKAEPEMFFYEGMDITHLAGGEYYLSVELQDDKKQLLARKTKYFVRVTDSLIKIMQQEAGTIRGMTAEAIKKFVPYLTYQIGPTDVAKFNRLKDKDDTMALKQWFYGYWEDKNADDPQREFEKFAALVNYVQTNFKTQMSEGYKTDRGRIYLRYGKPDYVAPYVDEPNAYPYEIWHYYKTDKKNNVKFIFYNPSQMHNDYILLHSEMPGERNNPNWKKMIYQRTSREKNIDNDKSPGDYGDNLDKRMKE